MKLRMLLWTLALISLGSRGPAAFAVAAPAPVPAAGPTTAVVEFAGDQFLVRDVGLPAKIGLRRAGNTNAPLTEERG